ncbi:hypothetical protein BJX66DRAFT_330288 [Aspergillus keveii]|uniref:F-box domain-containing protein n=1 Tax=Aspergillus keveii TaxID=714993 RepID=A0ABR4FL73_9EURO
MSSSDTKMMLESVPQDILRDVLARLDRNSLLSLCHVSKHFYFLSRPLLFQVFQQHPYSSERTLKRLRLFFEQLQTDTSLTRQVRSINIGSVEEPYIQELQDIFEDLLSHTPNLRHLCVPAGHFTKFLNHVLKEEDYLTRLESFESYDGPRLKYNPLQCWSSIFRLKRLLSLSIHRCAGLVHPGNELEDTLPELQGKGCLLLRRIAIKNSNLSYVTLAQFTYLSPSGWDDEDTSPTAIIRALLSHKETVRGTVDLRLHMLTIGSFGQRPLYMGVEAWVGHVP